MCVFVSIDSRDPFRVSCPKVVSTLVQLSDHLSIDSRVPFRVSCGRRVFI